MTPRNQSVLALVEQYQESFPEEAKLVDGLAIQLALDPDPFSRSNMVGHVTASMIVATADLQHVMLIHHKAYDRWLQPGGHVEPDDYSLYLAAIREAREETGVELIRAHPSWGEQAFDIDTHWIAPRIEKGEGRHRHHDIVFLGIAPFETPIRFQEEEVHGARWCRTADINVFGHGERLTRIKWKLARLIDGLRTEAAV